MRSYLLSLFGAALTLSLTLSLLPERSVRFVRLLANLLFVCILIAPLPRLLAEGESLWEQLEEELLPPSESREEELEQALQASSKTYFAQNLTRLLEQEFSIPSGELRCAVEWSDEVEGQWVPVRVTVILSGSAIWKDPDQIEATVAALLGCECVTAVE